MANKVNINTTNNQVTVTQGTTKIVTVSAQGPQGVQGPAGAAGPSGSVANTGSFATTGSNSFIGNQIITGSLIISGSSTFTNIGPAVFSGSLSIISGSLNITNGSLTGSLLGTASFATFALSASHEVIKEVSSSHANFADTASGLFGTPSILVNQITASGAISASGDIIGNNLSGTNTGDQDLSNLVTNSQTASFVVNSQTGSFITSAQTASFAITGSNVIFGNITSSGNISASGDITGNSITATSASLKHITNLTGITNDNIIVQPSVTFQNPPQFNNGILGDAVTGNSELKIGTSGFLGNTVSVNLTGTITASGNISASGDIVGSNLSGTNTGDQDLSNLVTNSSTASFAITGSNVLFGNITSSGNISASGDITAVTASLQRIEFPDNSNIISSPAGHKLEFGASELKLTSGDDVFLQLDDTITFANAQTNIPGNIIAGGTISNISTTHVTASGNISASNTVFGVTGSFNQISSNPASIKTNITMGSSNIDIGNTSTAASLGGSSFPFTKIAGSTNFQGMVAATNFLVGSGSLGEALGGIPVNSTLRIGGVGTGFLGTTYTVGVDITGNVTASGGISASGDIVGNNLSGTNTGDQDLSNLVTNSSTASFAITGSNVLFGNITSSGNISASSTIIANGLDIRGSGNATTFNDANITNVGQISLDSLISDGGGDNQIILNTANMDHRINDSGVMTLKEFAVEFFNDGTVGHITASGNISSSGDIIANKVTADVVDTSFETFLNFEAATAFTFIAPFPLTINFTGSSTSSMDVAGFVTASANTSTFSVQQTPPITLNIFDKLKVTPSSSGLFSFSGSRTI